MAVDAQKDRQLVTMVRSEKKVILNLNSEVLKRLLLVIFALAIAVPFCTVKAGELSEEETAFVDERNRRFQMCLDVLPKDVDDALRALSEEGLSIEFDCPEGSKKKECRITVKAEWGLSWDQIPEEYQDGDGYCEWVYGFYQTKEHVKVMGCQVKISLNVEELNSTEQRTGVRGEIHTLAVLYHELLHVQLPVDAMKTDEWRQALCNCQDPGLPGSGTDGHDQIDPFQEDYVERLWDKVQYEEDPWTVKQKLGMSVYDGTTGELLAGIALDVYSEEGKSVHSVVTDTNGYAEVTLPEGEYHVKAKIGILGFPVEMYASPTIILDKPHSLRIYIIAMFVPVKFLPTIIYCTLAALIGTGLYIAVKKATVRKRRSRSIDRLQDREAMRG